MGETGSIAAVRVPVDTLVHSAAQLVTLSGGPQRGSGLGSLGLIENGAVAVRGDHEVLTTAPGALLLKVTSTIARAPISQRQRVTNTSFAAAPVRNVHVRVSDAEPPAKVTLLTSALIAAARSLAFLIGESAGTTMTSVSSVSRAIGVSRSSTVTVSPRRTARRYSLSRAFSSAIFLSIAGG